MTDEPSVTELSATENARDIALQAAQGFMRDRDRWMESAERIADSLGGTPKVEVIRVIKVRFLRGAGIPPDPIREVIALFCEDGTPIVEIDPCMTDS